MAKIPTTPTEIAVLRQQLTEHLTDTGYCHRCGTRHCPTWRQAAIALWWTDLDSSYEPYATEHDRRLKREILLAQAGSMPTSLKAPLTEAEVAALRHQLSIHNVDGETGLCA